VKTFIKQKFQYPGKEKVSLSHLHLTRKVLMRSISVICSLPCREQEPNLVPNQVRGWYGPGTTFSGLR